MTLSPYLPPICVSEEAGDEDHVVHYLVDGGYVNIMPADVMRREQGPELTIAVDVSGIVSLCKV